MIRTISLIALLTLAQAPTAVSFARLQGRVLAGEAGTPIPHARVTVARVGGDIADYRTAWSDERGRFEVSDLAAASYRVFAERDGYPRAEFGRLPVSTTGRQITLGPGQTVADLVLVMTPPGVIAGRVLDRGDPASRVVIRAMKATYIDGRRSLSAVEYAETDDRGEFRVSGLLPGSYFVGATPAPSAHIEGNEVVMVTTPSIANGNRSSSRVLVSEDALDASLFVRDVAVPVFYPQVVDPMSATAIDVQSGAVAGPITLTLARVPPVHVRGRVDVSPGAARGPIRVTIASRDDNSRGIPSLNMPATTLDAAGGVFDLSGIPAGRFIVTASSDGPMRATGSASIEVFDRDVENVAVRVESGVAVRGRVTVDGAPITGTGVAVQLQLPRGGGFSAIRFDAEGAFTFENVPPGEYRLRVLAPTRPLWVASAVYAGEEVVLRPVRVSEGRSGVLDVSLRTTTASVDAVVLDRQQRPVVGALIIAVPDTARRDRSDQYKTATTDTEGRAHVEGLAPGRYSLFATTEVPANAWQDPAVIQRYEGRGEIVSLAERGRATVRLRVVP